MSTAGELATRFAESHPEDAARTLERSLPGETASFLDEAPPRTAAALLQQMNLSLAAECLSHVGTEGAAAIVAALPLDFAAVLLRRMDPVAAQSALDMLSDELAGPLKAIISYPEGSVGSITDPRVLALPEDMNIAEAQKALRRLAAQAHYDIYVVDRSHRLVGVLSIRTLFMESSKRALAAVMRPDVVRLRANTTFAAAVADPAWLEFDSLPVIDASNGFLGVVHHKTLRQLTASAEHARLRPDVTDMLVALADLYWTGLSRLLAGAQPQTTQPAIELADTERSIKDGE